MPRFYSSADAVPASPGSYVLALALTDSLMLPERLAECVRPGLFLYCGSAHGPGGLRARVGRHMRPSKTIRWHIDHLTARATVLGAWTFTDRSECELAAALAHLPAPVKGFGSSDCRSCRSHLLRWTGSRASLLRMCWEEH